MKFLLILIVFLVIVCIILHFSIMADLKEITEDLEHFYDDFSDDMQVLSKTLQLYHELLNDYQIPMIQLPDKQNQSNYSDW